MRRVCTAALLTISVVACLACTTDPAAKPGNTGKAAKADRDIAKKPPTANAPSKVRESPKTESTKTELPSEDLMAEAKKKLQEATYETQQRLIEHDYQAKLRINKIVDESLEKMSKAKDPNEKSRIARNTEAELGKIKLETDLERRRIADEGEAKITEIGRAYRAKGVK